MNITAIDDNPATILTGLAFLGFVLWKTWLRLRHDARGDQSEAREHEAEGDVIEVLRAEVRRCADSVRAISEELATEREARYEAERISRELRARVDILERRLRELGHTPP